jgi:hypothetical protein
MSFEIYTVHVVVSLDPYEGDHYNEPIYEDVGCSTIENIYKFIGCREEYVKSTTDRELSLRSVKYYDMDSKDALDRWKN